MGFPNLGSVDPAGRALDSALSSNGGGRRRFMKYKPAQFKGQMSSQWGQDLLSSAANERGIKGDQARTMLGKLRWFGGPSGHAPSGMYAMGKAAARALGQSYGLSRKISKFEQGTKKSYGLPLSGRGNFYDRAKNKVVGKQAMQRGVWQDAF